MWVVNVRSLSIGDYQSEEKQDIRLMIKLIKAQSKEGLADAFLETIDKVADHIKRDVVFIRTELEQAILLAQQSSDPDSFIHAFMKILSRSMPARVKEVIFLDELVFYVITQLKQLLALCSDDVHQNEDFINSQLIFLTYILKLSHSTFKENPQYMAAVIQLNPNLFGFIGGRLVDDVQAHAHFYQGLLSQNVLDLSNIPRSVM